MSTNHAALANASDPTVKWYAVQTYSNHEKRVTAEFEHHGINTFLPLLKQVRQWSDRTKVIETPMFSCYTFVQMEATPEKRAKILTTSRVIRLLTTNNNEPAPIPETEIDAIRTVTASGVPFAPHAFLRAGQRVRIRGGCLEGVEGILARADGKDKLVVSIDLIQRSVSVTIEGYRVIPV